MVNSLIVSNLSKRYGRRLVVDDLSFSMRSGEIVGLLGPNGAGKTTTFYMIVGFLKVRKGSIILNGEDVTGLPMHERSKKGLSYLPQEPSIFRKLSVRDNILLVAQSRNDLTRHEKHHLVDQLVEEFGLTHVVRQKGYTLSGGERRRCEIARALTDHNVRDTLAVTTNAHIINDGSILVSGTKNELLAHELARKIYFGDQFEGEL